MELETFKTKVLPLREKLMRVSQKLLAEKADVEDVVQEIFLKLWNIRYTLDQYKSVEALAVTMTKNLSLDRLRTKKTHGDELELIELDSNTRTPSEQLEQQDAANCIRLLINRLPSLQQTIIRMKDVEGYELNEIAEIIGTNIESVRSNLSRARKKVRENYLKMIQN